MRRVDISSPIRPFPCILLDDRDEGLLRRANRFARHALLTEPRAIKVELRKARQRSVAILKRSGLDRTKVIAY